MRQEPSSVREWCRSLTNPQREVLVLLMDSGDIRSFDLGAASAVKLSDPKLQSQLTAYLTVLNQSHARGPPQRVYRRGGFGDAEVTASYMTPAPVWKSSYRLMFGAAGEPTLEGWAIVDNTSGEDWNNVRLAVVSGKPVSFITQLYAAALCAAARTRNWRRIRRRLQWCIRARWKRAKRS